METELSNLCQKTFGGNDIVSNLKRLTGGASAATWSFKYQDKPLVLRQKVTDPTEIIEDMPDLQSVSLKTEAELITRARENGVRAPHIHAVTEAGSSLGEAVLMEQVMGEALPQRLFKDPKYEKALLGLTDECAKSLAKIHEISFETLKGELETRTPRDALFILESQFKSFGQTSPVLASAFSWMNENCPSSGEAVLLHGDFRMGNLLIDEEGISAVLDWELSHIGDPVSDISFFCAPPWRFGRYKKQAGGVGEMADLISTYETTSGRQVDAQRLLWWRLHASVNWCLICMIMANMWRSGADRELERIVIGTRVSESEVDILLLFDEIYGFQDKINLAHLNTDGNSGKGETKPEELTQAISEWLTQDIIPTTSGRKGFKARVARNAIGMLQRQSQSGSLFSEAQEQRLSKLSVKAADLCSQLLNGTLNIQSNELRHHLKLSTMEQLFIDQPKYAGFHVAFENWST